LERLNKEVKRRADVVGIFRAPRKIPSSARHGSDSLVWRASGGFERWARWGFST
jgi:hypothetical protein